MIHPEFFARLPCYIRQSYRFPRRNVLNGPPQDERTAESYFGTSPKFERPSAIPCQLVTTIPAHYVLQLINEPMAAAIAYGLVLVSSSSRSRLVVISLSSSFLSSPCNLSNKSFLTQRPSCNILQRKQLFSTSLVHLVVLLEHAKVKKRMTDFWECPCHGICISYSNS